MESVMTVRLNGDMKERAAAIMRREGYTPSSAVRRLFEYTVKHDGLPFEKSEKPDRDELRRRIEAFDQVHTKRPLTMSDEELREARLKDRYGASPVEAITPEELFARLARGSSRAAICDELTLSKETVKTHVRNIYRKMGIHSQQDLLAAVVAEQRALGMQEEGDLAEEAL